MKYNTKNKTVKPALEVAQTTLTNKFSSCDAMNSDQCTSVLDLDSAKLNQWSAIK